MPISPQSSNIRPNDSQFVSDLANLFRRHRVRCGDPEDLEHLGSALETNGELCGDLFLLCTAISHMGEADLSPDQMLTLIARAVAGPRAFDAKGLEIPQGTRYAFLSRYAEWSSQFAGIKPSAFAGIKSTAPDLAPEEVPGEAAWHMETPYIRAATLSAGQNLPDEDRARVEEFSSRISSPMAMGDLTLRQLSEYLMDLEHRVKRAEAYLEPTGKGGLPLADTTTEAAKTMPAEPALPESEANVSPLFGAGNETDRPAFSNVFVRPERGSPYFSRPQSKIERDVAAAYADVEPAAISEPERTPLPVETGAVRELFAETAATSATAKDGKRGKITKRLWISTAAYVALAGAAALGYRYYERAASDATSIEGIPAVSSPPPQPSPTHRTRAAAVSKPGAQRTRAPARSTIAGAGAATPTLPDASSTQRAPTELPASVPSHQPTAEVDPENMLPKFGEAAHGSAQPAAPDAQPVQLARSTPEMPTSSPPRLIIEPYNQRSNPEPAVSEPTPARGMVITSTAAPHESVPRTSSIATRPGVSTSAGKIVSVPSTTLMRYALATPAPRYPTGRHISMDTSVIVRATISKDGRVLNATAMSGADDLRGAAEDAMHEWRFRPYLVDGSPVEVSTDVRFVFKAP